MSGRRARVYRRRVAWVTLALAAPRALSGRWYRRGVVWPSALLALVRPRRGGRFGLGWGAVGSAALLSVLLVGVPRPVLAAEDDPPTTTTTQAEAPATTTTQAEAPTTTTTQAEVPTTTTTTEAEVPAGPEVDEVGEYRSAVLLGAALLVFLASMHVVGSWGRL